MFEARAKPLKWPAPQPGIGPSQAGNAAWRNLPIAVALAAELIAPPQAWMSQNLTRWAFASRLFRRITFKRGAGPNAIGFNRDAPRGNCCVAARESRNSILV